MDIAGSDIVIRLCFAALLGALVGIDRERLHWAAGLRTHMLVCVGAALFTLVSAYGFHSLRQYDDIVIDPTRIAAQIVSGIGFLGAGTIILRRDVVHGLTTAASLWAVAAVGMAAGAGMYGTAVTATVLIVVILAAIKPLERKFLPSIQERYVRLVADPNVPMSALRDAVAAADLHLTELVIQPQDDGDGHRIRIQLRKSPQDKITDLADRLQHIDGVHDIKVRID